MVMKGLSSTTVFVGNIGYGTTEDNLSTCFNRAGTIKSIHIKCDKETGKPKGYAFIEFESPEEAENACHYLNNTELNGRKISVSIATGTNQDTSSSPKKKVKTLTAEQRILQLKIDEAEIEIELIKQKLLSKEKRLEILKEQLEMETNGDDIRSQK